MHTCVYRCTILLFCCCSSLYYCFLVIVLLLFFINLKPYIFFPSISLLLFLFFMCTLCSTLWALSAVFVYLTFVLALFFFLLIFFFLFSFCFLLSFRNYIFRLIQRSPFGMVLFTNTHLLGICETYITWMAEYMIHTNTHNFFPYVIKTGTHWNVDVVAVRVVCVCVCFENLFNRLYAAAAAASCSLYLHYLLGHCCYSG